MSITLVVVAVLAIFTIFAAALAYGQLMTRGMVAPGAIRPD